MPCAPLALFAFNRPKHLAHTIAALRSNALAEETPVFVFCDGARHPGEAEQVRQVREIAKSMTGFLSLTVIEREHNLGLANSIIDGVSHLCAEYGSVIVLEDDLLTSPDFLQFMNQGLALYADDDRVASIHGYSYPIDNKDAPQSYFLRGADCWGWSTWARAWKHFEADGKKLLSELEQQNLGYRFDYDGNSSFIEMLRNQINGKNNSWAIRWHASAYLLDMLTLYPRQSLVVNFGFDDSGTHCSAVDHYATQLGSAPAPLDRVAIEESSIMRARMVEFFRDMRKKRWATFLGSAKSFAMRRIRKLFSTQAV
jgi:Glycosyl transferase family 2